MYRVLLLTDAINLQSGLARCGREIVTRFYNHPAWTIAQAGWHSLGVPHDFPIQIWPIARWAPDEPQRLLETIQQFRPHVFLTIGDPFYFQWLRELKKQVREGLHWNMETVGWITIDGEPLHPKQLALLLPFDRVLHMSEYGKAVTLEAIEHARKQEHGFVADKKPNGEPIPFDAYELDRLHYAEVLYPGVDQQVFHPIHPQPFWPGKDGKPYSRENKFVVLVVDQNTSRKAVGVALDAYREFRKNKAGKTALHLVTNPQDPNGINLLELLDTAPQDDIVIHRNSPTTGMTDEDMAKIYSVATVLFSASSGEGFKLPILEAMMGRCLNVMPAFTSPVELLGETEERGLLIDAPEGSYWYGSFTYRKRVISVEACVEALDHAYDLWELKGFSPILDRAQAFAQELTWDRTFDGLMKAIQGIYSDRPVDMVQV